MDGGMIEIAVAIAIGLLVLRLTFYTIKRVVVHVVTGYLTLLVIEYLFHFTIKMDVLMWALTVLFGPIAIIGAALWHLLF